jgi:phage terminase large subunit-like protein
MHSDGRAHTSAPLLFFASFFPMRSKWKMEEQLSRQWHGLPLLKSSPWLALRAPVFLIFLSLSQTRALEGCIPLVWEPILGASRLCWLRSLLFLVPRGTAEQPLARSAEVHLRRRATLERWT